MSCRRLLTLAVWVIAIAISAPSSNAFQLSNTFWPGARTSMYVNIPGPDADPDKWSRALVEAMVRWSTTTPFEFTPINAFSDPCAENRLNGVGFRANVCGRPFSSRTIAVTLSLYEVRSGHLIETDIVFNSNENWDVFQGPQLSTLDFRRVALHELGHVIGLDHDQTLPAIMEPITSNLEYPQSDDIRGVHMLYTGTPSIYAPGCTSPLRLNDTVNDILSGACIDGDLFGNGGVLPVRTYRVDVPTRRRLIFDLKSSQLDTFLYLTDSNFKVITTDDNSGRSTNSRIAATLEPGEYNLVASTSNGREHGNFTLSAQEISFKAIVSIFQLLLD